MTGQARNEPRIDVEEILEGIREWVLVETPSDDGAAVNRLVDIVAARVRALGAAVERLPGREGFGDILIARMPWGEGPGILVLSHLDTVHPMGTIDTVLPWRREGDTVYGPGVYDMKGGAYIAYYALRHLVRAGRAARLPVTLLFVPEEEVGSITSREVIEHEARRSRYVLVTEPGRDGGKVVTGRKGVGRFEVRITGRPAHAGVNHADGRSAIREMARQILAIEGMTDYARGITTNVGVVSGGTGLNVIPAECRAGVDLRFPDPASAEEMCRKILEMRPVDPEIEMTVTGGVNRPAYVKDQGIARLYEHARALAAEIGFELGEVPQTGGGSDGNFSAALGVPTLDGLGAEGKGAHTHHEQISVAALERRTRLWLRLFETLS